MVQSNLLTVLFDRFPVVTWIA